MSAANVPSELSATEIVELTIVVNEMAMNDAHINAYEARNARLLERKKNRIRYLNGVTEQPACAERLLANAENLTYNHRRTLARNISTVEQAPRPATSCAHHIVALSDKDDHWRAEHSSQPQCGCRRNLGVGSAGLGCCLRRLGGRQCDAVPALAQDAGCRCDCGD